MSAAPASVDIRIVGGLIVPVTAGVAPLEGGVIEVTGNRISHIGAGPTPGSATETIDARDCIVLPAFVNTHCHTSQQLGRGLADDVDLLTWLHARIWPYESALTEEDSEISALACAAEQIRSGVTLLADPGGQHVDGMARGMVRSGIRAFLGRSSMDEGHGLPVGWAEPTADVLAIQADLHRRWDGAADGRLRFSWTLRTIFNCSDALLEATWDAARAADRPVQMHVAEVAAENDYCRATRGTTTVRHLARLGLLASGFVGAHCVWLDDEEVAIYGASKAGVSHNVASNLKNLGFPRIADLLDAGAAVGIGTDGAPSNNRMCVIDELWAASLVQKALRGDPTVLPSAQLLRMGTIGGASMLGLGDELGTLEIGKLADLIIVDPNTANMITAADPVSAIITSMKTENIASVLCDGAWVMRDHVITAFDEPAVLQEAKARAADVRKRANITL